MAIPFDAAPSTPSRWLLRTLLIALPLACCVVAFPLLLLPRRQALQTPVAAEAAAPAKPPNANPRRIEIPAAAEPVRFSQAYPSVLRYSAIAAVFDANGGKIPATGVELTTALGRLGEPAQLPVSFSAVTLDSGLANPRVILAPDTWERARRRVAAAARGGWSAESRNGWSAVTAEGPERTAVISEAEANTPDFTGRLFLAVNMELTENGTPRARSVEFISWNSWRKRFDFGLIENLNDGGPRLRVVDEVKCVPCHKTRGPILGAGPWSNTIRNAFLGMATIETLGRLRARERFDGINVWTANAFEVDAHVRLGAERLHNREAFRLLTHSPEGRRVLAVLLRRLVTPAVEARAGRTPAIRSGLAAPLTELDRQLPAVIDAPLTRVGFDMEWLAFQQAAPSSILLDFSPAGPPPSGARWEWEDTPIRVREHDRSRAEGLFILPSQHRPSNPRAFLPRLAGKVPPSSTVNVTRLAEAIGVTEGDRHYLVHTLLETVARLHDSRSPRDVPNPLDNGRATAGGLATAVFEGPSFADVLKHGSLPDRDEFKDRFFKGLKHVLEKDYDRADAIAFRRADYASTPQFLPQSDLPDRTPAPTSACLRCHDVWSPATASLTDPLPALAFDPFDEEARDAWVRTATPARRLKVLGRMFQRLFVDRDMPPVDAPEYEKFRLDDPERFTDVRGFLTAELVRAKGG